MDLAQEVARTEVAGFARRARAAQDIPGDIVVAAIRAFRTLDATWASAFDECLATLGSDVSVTAAVQQALPDLVDEMLLAGTHDARVIPPNMLTGPALQTFARKSLLPALISRGLVAPLAAAATTVTGEVRARQLAATFVRSDGSTTSMLAPVLRAAVATPPTFPVDLRSNLQNVLRERISFVRETEPALFAVFCSGEHPGEMFLCPGPIGQNFGSRSCRRLALYLCCPLVAAALFRELQLSPPMASIDAVLTNESARLAKPLESTRSTPGEKRARE